MKNKYGKISGGSIFDYYDKAAHELAVETIGECVTASAEIKYLGEIEEIKEGFEIIDIISQTKNTITINAWQVDVAFAVFTFVKRKTKQGEK